MSARTGTALLFCAGLALAACDRDSENERWLDAEPAPLFEATAVRSGAPFRLAEQRGRVVLISFGFTSCLEICPLTLGKMQAVYRALGEDASGFRAVYASVDPARDQPQQFREFLRPFDARIEGLFIEAGALPKVLDDYGVVATKRPPEVRRYVGRTVDPERDYSMDHTASLWLIDPEGDLRVRYSHRVPPETIATGVRRLFQEEEG